MIAISNRSVCWWIVLQRLLVTACLLAAVGWMLFASGSPYRIGGPDEVTAAAADQVWPEVHSLALLADGRWKFVDVPWIVGTTEVSDRKEAMSKLDDPSDLAVSTIPNEHVGRAEQAIREVFDRWDGEKTRVGNYRRKLIRRGEVTAAIYTSDAEDFCGAKLITGTTPRLQVVTLLPAASGQPGSTDQPTWALPWPSGLTRLIAERQNADGQTAAIFLSTSQPESSLMDFWSRAGWSASKLNRVEGFRLDRNGHPSFFVTRMTAEGEESLGRYVVYRGE